MERIHDALRPDTDTYKMILRKEKSIIGAFMSIRREHSLFRAGDRTSLKVPLAVDLKDHFRATCPWAFDMGVFVSCLDIAVYPRAQQCGTGACCWSGSCSSDSWSWVRVLNDGPVRVLLLIGNMTIEYSNIVQESRIVPRV